MITCFTDGSALKNSKTSNAGWAFYISDINILRSGYMIGTNNAAELTAIYELFLYLTENYKNLKNVIVYTDSIYSINVITDKYNAKINLELIHKIKELYKKLPITFMHVRAHTKNTDDISKGNDIVDKEARRQAESQAKKSV